MNSICLPAPLVILLRRLFNAFSAFSISQTYLLSRWRAGQNVDSPDAVPSLATELEKQEISIGKTGLSWDLLMRLRRALPSRDRDGVLHPVALNDTVVVPRYLYFKPPFSDVQDPIHRLISNPQLFDPVRAPRYPIVLCHGLYGFNVRGPEAFPKLRLHYWSNVLHTLRKTVGAEVIVTSVPGTGSIASRAERMDQFLRENVKDRDVNFLGHSMGGLDCRHLITHIKPREYRPLSLTTLSAPHRGSPFMDWCLANIGIGSFPFSDPSSSGSRTSQKPPSPSRRPYSTPLPYSLSSPLLGRPSRSSDNSGFASLTLSMLPSNFTSLILSLIDSPAYANLTTSFLRDIFNPSTPDNPEVKYFSVAARTSKMSVWHPLWLPKLIVDAAEEQGAYAKEGGVASQSSYSPNATVTYSDMDLGWGDNPERGNDGLVSVSSAKWGNFLGTMEGCDHWELRGARGFGPDWEEGWGKMWREWVGKWRDSDAGKTARVGAALSRGNGQGESADERTGKKDSSEWVTKNDLASKFDLERFYVALSRKLYDEGL